MSDDTANGSKTGAGHPDAAKVREVAAASAAPSVAQGLQSVMAVIGENYDPGVSGAVDKTQHTPVSTPSAPKLTDKIDAARLKQPGGSSVAAGLQSIMAVIGESYEEEATPVTPPPSAPMSTPIAAPQPVAAPAPVRPTVTTAIQDSRNVDATDAISNLLPLLTMDEQSIAQTHHQVVSSDDMESGPVRAPGSPDSTIADLLNQLKSDISTLERGSVSAARQQFNMPVVIDTASNEVRTLLAELQGDISALRNENDALKSQYNVPTTVAAQGSEVAMLLNQLQGDISGLRQENDALKMKYGIAPAGASSEISSLLAQLQGDISGLRQENDSFKSYYNVPNGRSRGTSFGQAFLMTIGLLALVGGATIGGMYYANRMNDQNNENLFALLGLQQARTEKPVVTIPRPVVKEVVAVAPKKVEAPKVAAVTPAPPPALPKIVVKRPKLDSAEVQALLADAQNLIELGDLVSARQMLEYAMSQQSAEAAYKLAQTFDPLHLATMASVLSVEPNITRAKVLYYSAARQGHQAASKRLAELRRTP